jgi:hypothetical protein
MSPLLKDHALVKKLAKVTEQSDGSSYRQNYTTMTKNAQKIISESLSKQTFHMMMSPTKAAFINNGGDLDLIVDESM